MRQHLSCGVSAAGSNSPRFPSKQRTESSINVSFAIIHRPCNDLDAATWPWIFKAFNYALMRTFILPRTLALWKIPFFVLLAVARPRSLNLERSRFSTFFSELVFVRDAVRFGKSPEGCFFLCFSSTVHWSGPAVHLGTFQPGGQQTQEPLRQRHRLRSLPRHLGSHRRSARIAHRALTTLFNIL